jgi:aryl-alcohol dehydrogenase-like predicted oxidoreductase
MQSNSKIGLGTVQFGIPYGISNSRGKTSLSEVKQILNTAVKNKITFLDTASAYGDAEEILGQNDLTEFQIVSKFMPPNDGVKLDIVLSESLQKLKLPSLYGYLAHRPLELLNNQSLWSELIDLKDNGKIMKIGYSLNEPRELEILLKAKLIPDLVQVPYNYFDRRFEDQIKMLNEEGCEIHSRSTFLQGLFFMDADKLSSFFDEVKPHIKTLQKNKLLAKSLLNFVLNKDFIDKVVIGVENNKQLLENLDNSKEIELLDNLDFEFSKNILMPMFWPN